MLRNGVETDRDRKTERLKDRKTGRQTERERKKDRQETEQDRTEAQIVCDLFNILKSLGVKSTPSTGFYT